VSNLNVNRPITLTPDEIFSVKGKIGDSMVENKISKIDLHKIGSVAIAVISVITSLFCFAYAYILGSTVYAYTGLFLTFGSFHLVEKAYSKIDINKEWGRKIIRKDLEKRSLLEIHNMYSEKELFRYKLLGNHLITYAAYKKGIKLYNQLQSSIEKSIKVHQAGTKFLQKNHTSGEIPQSKHKQLVELFNYSAKRIEQIESFFQQTRI